LVGAGAVVLAPVILLVLRPLMVGAIKAGITVDNEAAQAIDQARVAVIDTARETAG
jgi:hypothetical protein